jgi:hypothetical protein
MTILRESTRWTKPRVERETTRSSELTGEEHEHVRAAIRFLPVRLGSVGKLAAAMRVKPSELWRALGKRGRPTAGLALRVSRVAEAPVESILTGIWPKSGHCAHCNRFQ